MGGLRSLATPAMCGRDTPPSPARGALGNGMLPVFLQHLPPPVGACGERNYGLFSRIFGKVGIPTLLPIATKRSISSKKRLAGARTSKIPARPDSGPKRAQKLATRGPGPNRTKPENPRFAHRTLKSSLLVAREQPI